MPRSRSVRAAGHVVRLALFALLLTGALRFFLGTVDARGWSPAALFALLLLTGAASLTWRSALDLRRALRRLRA